MSSAAVQSTSVICDGAQRETVSHCQGLSCWCEVKGNDRCKLSASSSFQKMMAEAADRSSSLTFASR